MVNNIANQNICMFNTEFSSHEVNIASIPSGYTLKPHYHKMLDDENENIMKVIPITIRA